MLTPLLFAFGPLDRLAATPTAYLLLWSGLIALGIAIMVLLRTGWGQSRPLRKCAVLSLLVHVLLACLAMTVKIVVGDGDSAQGVPIRVRILDAEVAMMTPEVSAVSPPALLPQPPEEIEEPPTEPPVEPADPGPDHAAASEAPAEIGPVPAEIVEPTPQIVPADASEATPTQSDATPMEVEASTNPYRAERFETSPSIAPYVAVQDTHVVTPTPVAVEATTPANSPPANPYEARTAADRLRQVESQGGNLQTEAAVAAALRWLATAQSSDGRWDADRFGAGIERRTLGENRNGAGREADTGITALALLAFLGAGHTHLEGDHQTTVQHGLEYLLRTQAADGSLFGGASLYARMYCHSMATFALAEAQAMSGDQRLGPGVSRAVGFCLRAQHPTDGGWRYEIGNKGDTSQLGWQTMAIASGERAGVAVPLQTWTGIERFLRGVRRGQFGGLASYQQFSPTSTSMTAEALYCRLLLTEKMGGEMDERAAAEATRLILAQPPNSRQVNLYYWYYATLALHHRHSANEPATAAWRTWNDSLTAVLLEGQIAGGANGGSWDPDMEWGGYGGRVYSTALAAMCLEVYYRYAPAPALPNPAIVTRP